MASTDLPLVLSIPRTNNPAEDFILLHVSTAGRHKLDLKLIGTDSESAFSSTITHDRASDHKTKNFSGTQVQWEEILAALLLGTPRTESTKDVEAVASVVAETSIKITIQKSIEGIKQRCGTISLAYTEDEEIDLFKWCALTIQRNNASSGGVAGLQTQLEESQEEVEILNEKLEELVKAKAAFEDELIEKFSILLNQKKLKIRDQQRLLASASVDPAKLEEVKQGRISGEESLPGPSRRGKRKAAEAARDASEDDTDEGFEKMNVDTEAVEPNSANEDERRTDDEESTADEDSGDEPPPKQLPTRHGNAMASSSGTATEQVTIPPKRDLPFSKKPAPPAEESETESDDEL